jgi:hypothetical protein
LKGAENREKREENREQSRAEQRTERSVKGKWNQITRGR